MAKPDLADYIEVRERIAAFHERYPDGSLQGRHWIENHGGQDFLVYQAKAYRSPDDKRPGIGHAWEPLPGVTSFTKGSELMVGETSGWGRALAALGFEVSRSIASREEVTAREGNGSQRVQGADEEASEAQRDYLLGKGNRKGLIANAPLADTAKVKFAAWAADGLTKARASKLIETLKDDPEKGADLAAQMCSFTDLPADTEGLPPAPSEEDLAQLGLKADDE